jgi:hypothetical protein
MASLSVDKHCEMLTAHIRDRSAAITEGFKLFIQMFSAVVGGALLLRLQYPKIAPCFALLADALTGLIFVMGVVIILENVRSWYEYRKVLSDVAGNDESGKRIIPGPLPWKAVRIETVMITVMIIAWLAFCWFNPLRLSN